jgi:hypothetical protein
MKVVSRRTKVRKPKPVEVFAPEEYKEPKYVPEQGETRTASTIHKRSRYMLWSVALVSLSFFIFSISFLFSEAEITVNPKVQDVTLDENLSASKNPGNDISFEVVVIEGEESKQVPASGEKEVVERATGTVLIYNSFNSSSQRLDVDTRLEGSNGKIYKTKTQIVVPGMRDEVPGSVEVGIYATEAGEEYNSEPLDFNIVGFRDTPRYSKFYARSKGAISGGMNGNVPAVSDEEKDKTISELKVSLEEKLVNKAGAPGFILFKDATHLRLEEPEVAMALEDGNAVITQKGTLYGFIFDEEELTKKIASRRLEEDTDEVYIKELKDLKFSLSQELDISTISFSDIKNISFNISGPAKIVWKINEDELIAGLLGESKKDFYNLLSGYSSIDSATLTLRPIWRRSIPEDIKDVKVIVNYPN